MSNILVVDDSPAVLKIVRLALSSQGHQVLICNEGEKALEILNSDPTIKLGILDFNMPGLSGINLIHKAKQTSQNTQFRILVLSVESKLEIISDALLSGADAWIIKPFKNELLINKVTELLEVDERK